MKKEKSYFLKNIWKLLECSKREEKRNKKNEKTKISMIMMKKGKKATFWKIAR